MKFISRRWKIIIISVLLAAILVYPIITRSVFQIESTEVEIYRDGSVHVTQTLTLDEFSPEVTISLLSTTVENLLILDENQMAVDYQLSNDNLTIYSFGASHIQLEYYTNALTTKESEIWTLFLENSYELTALFPINSTIIYLSDLPKAIDASNGEMSLSLGPGNWEISYLLELSTNEQDDQEKTPQDVLFLPHEYLITIIGVVIFIVFLLVVLLIHKRKQRFSLKKALNENPQLMKEDRDVLQFLNENGGKAFESEIRSKFPDIPRTSLWRLVKRLEKLELVEVKKIGLENQVSLKK